MVRAASMSMKIVSSTLVPVGAPRRRPHGRPILKWKPGRPRWPGPPSRAECRRRPSRSRRPRPKHRPRLLPRRRRSQGAQHKIRRRVDAHHARDPYHRATALVHRLGEELRRRSGHALSGGHGLHGRCRQIHVHRLGAKQHLRGVAEAPAGSTMTSAPSRSRDRRTPSSSDVTTIIEAVSASTAINAINAVSAEEPNRRVIFLHAR